MTREPVTIVIPIGPEPSHREWANEALESAVVELQPLDALLVVADGWMTSNMEVCAWALKQLDLWPYRPGPTVPDVHGYRLPWRMGVAGAFNAGVGWAQTELVVMLGSDDLLLPGAIDACVGTWEDNDRADAYYWMSIEYGDDRKDKIQALPCNAAMVTRAFWRWSGGFPVETASGAPDAALVSMLMVHAPEKLIAVQQGTAFQWVRVHEGQDTAGRAPWQGVIHQTRDILTKRGFDHG